MKTRLWIIAVLFLWVSNVLGQSIEVVDNVKLSPNSSVLVQYNNLFGKYEMPETDVRFPYSLICMRLKGNEAEVTKAKEVFQLYLGTQKMVTDQYRDNPNEILFLIENTVRNVYITCGDGCERELLVSNYRFRPNSVYYCTVRYVLGEDAIKEKGHVKWNIQPQEVVKKATIKITTTSGKQVYKGTFSSDTLAFLDYSMGYPYIYSISCPLYATYTDTILLTQKKVETKSVTLKNSYNHIRVKSLNSTPILFTIDNDTKTVYRSDQSEAIGPLEAGTHVLHCTQELYENQDLSINLNGDCTTKEFTPQMVHSVGSLSITTTPTRADIYIDDELKGKTPFKSNQYPTGYHHLKVVMDGFVPIEKDVEVKKGEPSEVALTLNNEANVYITTTSVPSTLYICHQGQSRYEYLGERSWSGNLGVGKYLIKATAPDHYDQVTMIEVTKKDNRFFVTDPPHHQGYLSVKVHPAGATVFVDDKAVSSKKVLLNTGQHKVRVVKSGYSASETHTVTITKQQTTEAEFKLQNQWVHDDDYHPDHNFEVTYGLGFQNGYSHYVGATYGYLPKRFGLNLSTLYGITTKEVVLTAGPSMRLTNYWSPLNLQLAIGAGGVYDIDAEKGKKFSWAVDSELRFAFEPENNFAWYSFGLGLKYFNQRFVPTFSLSLIPIRGLCKLAQIEEDFPAHRLEAMAGYSFLSHDWRYGFNYSWTKSHLGLYTQMLFGKYNNYSITAGPTFRLTPSSTVLDLQLYQGIGWFRDRNMDRVGGETGLRLAFDNVDLEGFGWWSLNAGFEYAQNGYYGVNFGLSLMPIGGAILLGDVYSDFPEFRLETVAGCGFQSGAWKLGYNFSWNATAIGCYTQMMFGWRDNYSITVGPTFRITPMLDIFDLQIYQGIGWFRDHGDMIGGETGIRFAFSNSNYGSGFGWWSLNLGCEYAQDGYVGINFGVSLGIIGLVSTCGLLAIWL